MSVVLEVKFGGLDVLDANVKALLKEMKKVQRRAVTKAGRILRGDIKPLIPKESGLMRKRLVTVVRTYKNSSVQAVVGVEKGPAEMVKVKKVFRFVGKKKKVRFIAQPKPEFTMVKRNPVKVLHLIELGFTRADGKHIPGKHPLRNGHAAAKGEMESTMAREFSEGINGAPLK